MRTALKKEYSTRSVVYFCILLVLLFSGFLVYQVGKTEDDAYFDAHQTSPITGYKGMMLGWSNTSEYGGTMVGSFTTLKDVNLGVDVVIPTNQVNMYIVFYDRGNQTHSFAEILPFPIHDWSVSNIYNIGSNITYDRAYNITDSSSLVVLTWKSDYNESTWDQVELAISTYAVGNLVSDLRGDYQFYLPVGVFASQDVLGNATKLVPGGLSFSLAYGYNITASVTIPKGMEVTQLIPSSGFQEESIYGTPGTYYYWQFITPQIASSITVDYQNNNETSAYQNFLFYGGVLIGVGTSISVGAVFEIARFFYDSTAKKRSGRKKPEKPWELY